MSFSMSIRTTLQVLFLVMSMTTMSMLSTVLSQSTEGNDTIAMLALRQSFNSPGNWDFSNDPCGQPSKTKVTLELCRGEYE
jgi:hypothetical protein